LTFSFYLKGVLTFDEFMMAYVPLQRGGDNPEVRWQSALRAVPAGVFSRPDQLNSREAPLLLQRMNQLYQNPNFNPAMQHNLVWSQLTPQLARNSYVPQEEFFRATPPIIQPHIY